MKKLSILLLWAVALISTFSACSSDDDNSPAAPAGPSLIGKWEWTSIYLTPTGGQPSEPTPWPAGLSDSEKQCGVDYITFTNATTGSYTDSELDSQNVCQSTGANIVPLTYTLSNKNLTLKIGQSKPISLQVTSLTDTELRLSQTTTEGVGTYILVRK